MKNFNPIRYAVPVWIVLVFAVVVVITRVSEPETHISTFCAYGKVFVEFDEGNKRWGTILLNDNGKPIPCNDPTGTPVISRQQENII